MVLTVIEPFKNLRFFVHFTSSRHCSRKSPHQNFYSFIDSRLLYLLNQFGAKIDNRNYDAVKNDIIKNRKLSRNGVEELVIQICNVLMPKGYEKIILKYILPSIDFAEKWNDDFRSKVSFEKVKQVKAFLLILHIINYISIFKFIIVSSKIFEVRN